jgi:hypothetical protein
VVAWLAGTASRVGGHRVRGRRGRGEADAGAEGGGGGGRGREAVRVWGSGGVLGRAGVGRSRQDEVWYGVPVGFFVPSGDGVLRRVVGAGRPVRRAARRGGGHRTDAVRERGGCAAARGRGLHRRRGAGGARGGDTPTWLPTGERTKVYVNRERVAQSFFGALDLRTGKMMTYMRRREPEHRADRPRARSSGRRRTAHVQRTHEMVRNGAAVRGRHADPASPYAADRGPHLHRLRTVRQERGAHIRLRAPPDPDRRGRSCLIAAISLGGLNRSTRHGAQHQVVEHGGLQRPHRPTNHSIEARQTRVREARGTSPVSEKRGAPQRSHEEHRPSPAGRPTDVIAAPGPGLFPGPTGPAVGPDHRSRPDSVDKGPMNPAPEPLLGGASETRRRCEPPPVAPAPTRSGNGLLGRAGPRTAGRHLGLSSNGPGRPARPTRRGRPAHRRPGPRPQRTPQRPRSTRRPPHPANERNPRPMNLVLLNAFVTVAGTGSISAAARLLLPTRPQSTHPNARALTQLPAAPPRTLRHPPPQHRQHLDRIRFGGGRWAAPVRVRIALAR